jgi:hypothetical protein
MHRCYYPKHSNFKRYGGRGIKICDRWHDFRNFLADMGERLDTEYTIDRIDTTETTNQGTAGGQQLKNNKPNTEPHCPSECNRFTPGGGPRRPPRV